MKVRDVIRMIKADGWFEVRRRGSHRQFKRTVINRASSRSLESQEITSPPAP